MPPVLYGQAEAGRHRRPRRAVRASLRPAQGPQVDREQRGRLVAAKLDALVASHWGPTGTGARVGAFPNGAGVASDGGDAWLLAEDEPRRALGAALAWALRQGAARLHLLLNAPPATVELAGVLARRAELFGLVTDVWLATGRELSRVEPAAPEELGVLPPEVLLGLRDRIRAAGAEPVHDRAGLVGEVLGLEVCRVVADADGYWRLAVGVGKYDREIHATLRAGGVADTDAVDEALRRVIREVRDHRRPGAGAHPANTLATERWLRAVVLAHPDLVGATSLRPIETVEPRTDLRQAAPAAATGTSDTGAALLVVCTAGTVDLEVVPIAADTRLSLGGHHRLLIAVDPAADARITRDLAAALREPAAVTVVPADWRGLPV